jgi:sugar phosphate isomerase/epimerase
MNSWQPIETAPKIDGRFVLLHPSRCWSADVNCDAEVGYWDAWAKAWLAVGPTAEDYTGPTHWMPLPAPPETVG